MGTDAKPFLMGRSGANHDPGGTGTGRRHAALGAGRRLGHMTGYPVISVPCGLCDEGLPVGLQITGRRLEDDLVLRLAAEFEAAQPWPRIAPL